MALNFPSSPQLDDVYTEGNRSWRWNGRFWQATSVTTGYAGSAGATGFTGSVGFTGSQGPAGTGITLLGSVNTSQDLPSDGTSDGSTLLVPGDAYITADTGHLWIWNGSAWSDVGQFTGEIGPVGYTGSRGLDGQGIIEANIQGDDLVVTYADSTQDNLGRVTGYTGSQGLGLDEWIKITSNYTASSGNRIIADTTAGSFTITLPSSPSVGSYIVLTDGGNWRDNPLTISAGEASIEGYNDDVLVDIGGVTTELLWDGSIWQITATIGAAGNPGPGVPDGGTTGQILAKLSNTDYDTAWVDPTGGADLGSLSVTGSTISTTDSSAITIDRNLVVDGDLLPESDSIYDLGSPTRKWHSLYVSGNSVYINDTPLTIDQNGDLLVGGALPQSNIVSLEDIPDVVISGATPGQVLGYTGSNWTATTVDSISALDDIPDVVVSNAVLGQVLGYTGSNWTATTVEGGGGGADSYVKTYFWEGALQENVSRKRFYIHVNSTLETIVVNLGTSALTETTIAVKRNGTVLNSINIPANTTYKTTSVSHSLAVNDYITVDITKSSSAENLYVTLVYRE